MILRNILTHCGIKRSGECHLRTIVILGPAGSGKSVLAGAITHMLQDMGMDALILNLDPAAITYPYDEPDIDIRKYVRTERVIRKFNLGPNGGLIASIDIAAKFSRRIKREIIENGPEYLVVDTPGQLEIFVFRNAGIILLREAILSIPDNKSLAVFLFDPFLCSDLNSMLSLLLLAASVSLRIQMQILGALTKIDIIPEAETKRIWNLLSDPRQILLQMQESNVTSPIRKINPYAIKLDVWPVSGISGEGLKEFLTKIEDLLGED